MEEEKEVIQLDKKQVFELVQIVFDNDKDAALKFLEKQEKSEIRSKTR